MRSDGASAPRRRLLGAAAALAGVTAFAPARAATPAQAAPRVNIVDDLQRSVPLVLPLKRVVIFNRYTTGARQATCRVIKRP